MQIFIGGACAGKRDAVTARFPQARWVRAAELADTLHRAQCEALVINGWLDEISQRIAHEASDDTLRAALTDRLDELLVLERQQGIEVIVILTEVGRGIVPLALEKRRLRDLAGWLAQDAVKRATRLWYVRHGLVRELETRIDLPQPNC